MVDRIADKIGKVVAMLDGATTEGEANAALARATALLEGTGLTLDEFRDRYGAESDEKPEEVEIKVTNSWLYVPGAKLLTWRLEAALTACHAAGVDIIYKGNGTERIAGQPHVALRVVGTEDGIAAAAALLGSLVNETFPGILRSFHRSPEYQASGSKWRRRLTGDFTLGFWTTLCRRAEDERRQREAKGSERLAAPAAPLQIGQGEACTALVRATDVIRAKTRHLMKVEETKVRASVKLSGGGRSNAKVHTHSAYAAGKAASAGVGLRATGRATRMIGQ